MRRSHIFEQEMKALIEQTRSEIEAIDAQIYSLTWWREDMVIGKFRYWQKELFKTLMSRGATKY